MAKKTVKIHLELPGTKPIAQEAIAQANERVSVVMRNVVREYEKKEVKSLKSAAKLVLNS